MSEETIEKNFKEGAQSWISVWIDSDGGLGFEGNSASTTQLLGMVKMAEQMIIQRALSGQTPTDS
jgi:hypothetical protein